MLYKSLLDEATEEAIDRRTNEINYYVTDASVNDKLFSRQTALLESILWVLLRIDDRLDRLEKMPANGGASGEGTEVG